MSTLLELAFALAAVAALTFWALFFFVVKIRIADRGLKVEEGSRFGFLVTKWPHEEMDAYLSSLTADERARPINRFLRNAHLIIVSLVLLLGAVLAISIITGG